MSEKNLTLYKGNEKTEIQIGVDIYKKAAERNQDVFAFLDSEYAADVDRGTSASEQIMAQMGMPFAENFRQDVGNLKINDALDGKFGAAITRDSQPVSRILTPAIVMKMVEDKLAEDKSSDLAIFQKQIGATNNINGNRFEQPMINFDIPKEARAKRIGQLSLPVIMGTLTVSGRQGVIPTVSIGLEISHEARKAFSFDQVAMVLAKQKESQQTYNLYENLSTLVNGDEDLAQSALPVVKASIFDAAATTAATFSQKALLRMLRQDRLKRQINVLWGTLETYEAYVARTGRPTAQDIKVASAETAAALARPLNLGVQEPEFWIVEDSVLPAGRLVGLDTRYAIEKFTNLEANYEATEELVMRKGTQMRFDSGDIMRRWHDEAWLAVDMIA